MSAARSALRRSISWSRSFLSRSTSSRAALARPTPWRGGAFDLLLRRLGFLRRRLRLGHLLARLAELRRILRELSPLASGFTTGSRLRAEPLASTSASFAGRGGGCARARAGWWAPRARASAAPRGLRRVRGDGHELRLELVALLAEAHALLVLLREPLPELLDDRAVPLLEVLEAPLRRGEPATPPPPPPPRRRQPSAADSRSSQSSARRLRGGALARAPAQPLRSRRRSRRSA